jgi:hypothetical protein
MTLKDNLAGVFWEADRHLAVLTEALEEWNRLPTITWQLLEGDHARVRIVDQILFRFIKLQDTVGERLIPATLASLYEPLEDRPMRDRLNRLEKLGYLDVDHWLSWREIRNKLAHEYPDQPDIRFASLLAAIGAAKALATLYQSWRARLETSIK